MSLTDLTGTTWVFNDTGLSKLPTNSYKLNCSMSCANGDAGSGNAIRATENWIAYPYIINSEEYSQKFPNIYFQYSDNYWKFRQDINGEILRTNNVEISINGGDDATNADLISWFEENAKLKSSNQHIMLRSSSPNITFKRIHKKEALIGADKYKFRSYKVEEANATSNEICENSVNTVEGST